MIGFATPTAVLLLGCCMALATALTRMTISRAPRLGLIDIPNDRSSHVQPTPRGGGLGLVVATLLALLVTAAAADGADGGILALAGTSAAVAAVGLVDDVRSVSSGVRLLVHVGAALVLVLLTGGETIVVVNTLSLDGVAAGVVAVIGITWATNLFNFMDGLDGVAGAQGAVAGLTGAALLAGQGSVLTLPLAVVGGSCLVFLRHNWQPARIFMGDVGSGFVGFLLAGTGLLASQQPGIPLLLWSLPLLPFVIDATATLIFRLARGERPDVAHRDHAYQKANQQGRPHRTVATWIGGLALLGSAAAALASWQPVVLWPLWLVLAGTQIGLWAHVVRTDRRVGAR